MEQRARRKPNWMLQAILCAGVVIWQSFDLATAVKAPSTALLMLQGVLLACGLVGGVGARWSCWRGALSQAGDRGPRGRAIG